MGKRNAPPLPGADDNKDVPEETADEVEMISIELAFVEPRPGTSSMRVDVSHMTMKQKIGLHFLASSLDKSGAVLENGTRVTRGVEALKWVCEQIAKQLPTDWKPDRYKSPIASPASVASE